MEILELFDNVTYDMPTLTERPPVTTNFNDIHRFTGKILVKKRQPNGAIKPESMFIELWEICPGILVSPDRLNCGIAQKDNGEEIPDGWIDDQKYYHKARLTSEYLGESLELQRDNYLKAVIKLFKYYKNNIKKSENVRKLMKRVQLEPIFGHRLPTDAYFTDVLTPANSMDIYIKNGEEHQYVGKKWVNLVIIPPTTLFPLNASYATSGIIPKDVGFGYYGIIGFDPFMSERITDDPAQKTFINNPALRLAHEMIHVMHYHRGVSNLVNDRGNEPEWANMKHRITGLKDDGTVKDFEKLLPMEEIITFNKLSIHKSPTISKARYENYVDKIINSKPIFSDPTNIRGALENLSDFFEQFSGDELSKDFIKLVSDVYGFDYSNGEFVVTRKKVEKYVRDAFIVNEVKIAEKLGIITRPYYNVDFKQPGNNVNLAYRIDVLNDAVFSIKGGMKSQRPEDHELLTVLDQPSGSSTINVEVEGNNRISISNSSSYYLQDDDVAGAVGGVEIDENSSIIESTLQISNSISENMIETTTYDDKLHFGIVGGTEFTTVIGESQETNDLYPNFSISVKLKSPTAPMINEVMTNNYTKVPEARPVLNQDLIEVLRSESDIYVPKIKAMTTLESAADVSTGAIGFALWANNIIQDISEAIRLKHLNYQKLGNDIMSFIPFYCTYTNLSEKDYLMGFVNAELDSFSIFTNSGSTFKGLSTLIASITANLLVPKQMTSLAYQDALDKYLEQYSIDMNNFVFESFLQWQENIVRRLANESRVAIQGFSNMLNTTEATMWFDAERANYSDADKTKNIRMMETTHEKFDELLQEFAKNCMISNTENALKIFNNVMYKKIFDEFVKYNQASYDEFTKNLQEAYAKGVIGFPVKEKYELLRNEVFWDISTVNLAVSEAKKLTDLTIQEIKSSSLKWNLTTDFTGNALHIDTIGVINSAPKDIRDLYGNYNLAVDEQTVLITPARFDRVLKIEKSTTPNTVALTISSQDNKKYKLIKGVSYTVSFWLRMPIPHSSEERKLFSYSAYTNDKELEELVLEVKNNNFILRSGNQWTNNEFIIKNHIALNRWVKITLAHGNDRIRVFVDTTPIGEINTSSREKPISPRGVLRFYNFNVDYQIDEISHYNRWLTDSEVHDLFKDKVEYARDYWGERLEYNKDYYLLSNNNKAAFVKNTNQDYLNQKSVPAVFTKYLGLDSKFYGYYSGLQFSLQRVSGKNNDKFVRMNDKFTLKSKDYIGSIAIIERGHWPVFKKYLEIVQPSDGYDAEVFRFDSTMFSKNSEILIGTGENAWKESLEQDRGTSDELWLNPQHMSGYTTPVNKDSYNNGEIRNNFEWIFVPKDPNWTEE